MSIRDEVANILDDVQEKERRWGHVATPGMMADELAPVIRRLQAEAWNKAIRTVFNVSIEQGDNWTPGDFHNPYKENDA